MWKFKPILLLTVIAASSSYPSSLQARDVSCNYLAGQLVFQDTLYGVAIGGLIGGLAYLSSDRDKDYQQPLATGALAGASLGLGFGAWEVSQRDCKLIMGEHTSDSQQLFSVTPLQKDGSWSGLNIGFSVKF